MSSVRRAAVAALPRFGDLIPSPGDALPFAIQVVIEGRYGGSGGPNRSLSALLLRVQQHLATRKRDSVDQPGAACPARFYRPFHAGGRFSIKALAPSRASSLVKMAENSPGVAQPNFGSSNTARRTSSLAMRTARGPFEAIV